MKLEDLVLDTRRATAGAGITNKGVNYVVWDERNTLGAWDVWAYDDKWRNGVRLALMDDFELALLLLDAEHAPDFYDDLPGFYDTAGDQ